MGSTLKTILAIVGLILIGFVAGFLTNRQLTVGQINKVAKMRFAHGFEQHLYRLIEADETQIELLEPIVKKYAEEIADEHKISREKRKKIVDSLHAKIKPHLSTEQIDKLKSFSRKYRERRGVGDPHKRKEKAKGEPASEI